MYISVIIIILIDQYARCKTFSNYLEKYIKEEIETKKTIAKEAIYNTLAKEYINEFNISKENISKNFKINYNINTIIESIYVMDNSSSLSTYIISGYNVTMESQTTFKLAITLDSSKGAFVIYPKEYLDKHGYSNLKIGDKVNIKTKSIEKNNYNEFMNDIINDENMCKEYLSMYKTRMIYNVNGTYEKLDKEYRNKRFGSKEKFKEYLKENSDNIYRLNLKQYAVVSKNSYKDYICIDNNDNYYIFRQLNNSIFFVHVLSKSALSIDTFFFTPISRVI